MWPSAARNRGSGNMLKLQNLNLPTHQNSRGSKKHPFLTYQRIRWLVVLLIFGVIVWLFVRFGKAKEQISSPPYAGPRQALIEDGLHGFLPLGEARDFCQKRRWEPYATRVRTSG